MKVAFNISPLNSGHKTRGIGSYTFNLLKELKRQQDVEIQEFTTFNEIKDADVIHVPYFDLFQHTLPLKKKFPTIVTIHDVTPLVFPKQYPKGIRGSVNLTLQKLSLKNVSCVITDSHSSKTDIHKYLNVPLEKIDVVHLAPAENFKVINDKNKLNMVAKKYNLPEKFALYTGNINWNKNLLNLTDACKKAGIDLVMVGSGFEKKNDLNHPELRSYQDFLDKYAHDPNVKILGYVDTVDLVAIMNLATVVLLPSFYEGFGLPILESQASGTPVITSKLSSMPEVAGDGAVLVDPYSVEEIAKAIIDVISDKAQVTRHKLHQAGLDNIRRFSWEKCAKETVEIYKKVLK